MLDLDNGQITGPVWTDACGHGGYVCSFEHRLTIDRVDKYDLYVFDQPDGQEICLRFGSEGHEYCSPGPIHQVCSLTDIDDKYRRAVNLLRKFGTIKWERSPEQKKEQKQGTTGDYRDQHGSFR